MTTPNGRSDPFHRLIDGIAAHGRVGRAKRKAADAKKAASACKAPAVGFGHLRQAGGTQRAASAPSKAEPTFAEKLAMARGRVEQPRTPPPPEGSFAAKMKAALKKVGRD